MGQWDSCLDLCPVCVQLFNGGQYLLVVESRCLGQGYGLGITTDEDMRLVLIGQGVPLEKIFE